MSVQVSYKKQLLFGIILLLVIVSVIEVLANIWFYGLYTCDFENNIVFSDIDKDTKRKLCLDAIDNQHVMALVFENKITINIDEGFRGGVFGASQFG